MSEKVLTYEEAIELCGKAFDGGVTYGSESMRYGCNAVAYDWEHWLKKNEKLFKPKLTTEDVLRDFRDEVRGCCDNEETVARYAELLTLREDA